MAKGPGGFSVGKVSLRVVPDTSGFREETIAGIKKEMAGFAVKVQVKPDLDGFREKVKAETAGWTATVKVKTDRSELDRLQDEVSDVKVGTRLNKGSLDLFQQRMRKELEGFERDIEMKIPLTPAGENFRRNMTREVNSVRDALSREVPKSMLGATSYRESVLAMVKNIRAQLDSYQLKTKVTADIDYDQFQKNALQELAKMSKDIEARIPVTPDGEEFRRKLR